jgi:hypothetical protein
MEWLDSQGLSALVGLGLIFGVLYLTTETWLRGILMLSVLAFVAVPFAQGGDYGIRILLVTVAGAAALIGMSVYFAWDGGWTAWHVKFAIAGLAAVSVWMWLQRDAPWKVWVLPVTLLVVAGWLYVVLMAPGEFLDEDIENDTPDVVDVEHTPISTLLKRDAVFLQGLYDATNGRPDIYVSPWDLLEDLRLTSHQAEVAADRLARSGSIHVIDSGIALKRKGAQAVEHSHREKRKRPPVSNTFNFHGNPSGVFGSHNKVRNNTFQPGVPLELVQAALAAAAELRGHVAPDHARDIELAEADILDAGADQGRIRRGARQMAEVAGAVGEVGAPLLRAAIEILRVVPS